MKGLRFKEVGFVPFFFWGERFGATTTIPLYFIIRGFMKLLYFSMFIFHKNSYKHMMSIFHNSILYKNYNICYSFLVLNLKNRERESNGMLFTAIKFLIERIPSWYAPIMKLLKRSLVVFGGGSLYGFCLHESPKSDCTGLHWTFRKVKVRGSNFVKCCISCCRTHEGRDTRLFSPPPFVATNLEWTRAGGKTRTMYTRHVHV